MDFSLSPEYEALREQAQKFGRDHLAPIAAKIDEEEAFPLHVYKKMGEAGFIGAAFPEEYGGAGADLFANAIIKEELAVFSPGFAMSVGTSAIFFAYNVLAFGTDEQKKKYIPAILRGEKMGCWCLTEPGSGSDALSVTTKSVKVGNEWVINGTKTFITNAPIGDYFLVVTRTSGSGIEGGTNFLIDRNTPGLKIGKPFKKLGMRCSPTSEVILENVRVPESAILGAVGRGFKDMMSCLDSERATAPITSIAIARACLEKSVKYAKERHQFGKPIAEFQMTQQKLAEMAIGIAVARTYAYRVIAMKQEGKDIKFEVAMAKKYASDMAQKTATEAVQIFGGYGFIQEYDVERFYRDVKITAIGGGTSEVQTLIIAKELLKGKTP